jgi:hypothetical protein
MLEKVYNIDTWVIKLFTDVNYEFSLKARVLSLCKPLRGSIVFAGKAWAYPSEALLRCFAQASWPCPQTIDYVGKDCQEQTF